MNNIVVILSTYNKAENLLVANLSQIRPTSRMIDLIFQYALIVGSRYAPGGGVDGHWGWGRVFLSHVVRSGTPG